MTIEAISNESIYIDKVLLPMVTLITVGTFSYQPCSITTVQLDETGICPDYRKEVVPKMNSMKYDHEGSSANYLYKVADFESKLKFDTTTYHHSLSVAGLSVQLLNQSKYNLDKNLVYYAGLFHDIGKSITPITVLEKENPLSPDEFEQIKEHAKHGFRILQKYKFPSDVLFAALLHHERYDGSGYPIGFTGEEIPVIARIVNICDVFDALTSDRPYRKAFSFKNALQMMEQDKEQYDPELADIFLTGVADKKIKKCFVLEAFHPQTL